MIYDIVKDYECFKWLDFSGQNLYNYNFYLLFQIVLIFVS